MLPFFNCAPTHATHVSRHRLLGSHPFAAIAPSQNAPHNCMKYSVVRLSQARSTPPRRRGSWTFVSRHDVSLAVDWVGAGRCCEPHGVHAGAGTRVTGGGAAHTGGRRVRLACAGLLAAGARVVRGAADSSMQKYELLIVACKNTRKQ